jgi:hypothetical protein
VPQEGQATAYTSKVNAKKAQHKRARGSEPFTTGIRFFAERWRLCRAFFSGARQRRLCREPNKKHSAKPRPINGSRQRSFFAECQKKTLGKGFFAECQSKTLGKAIFQTTFWCPKRIQIKKVFNYKVS